jgi:2-dehydropantoate 2-reductase
MLRAGHVRFAGRGRTSLARKDGQQSKQATLTAMLSAIGIASEVTESAAGLVWGKLVANAAINPMTALLEVPNGALLHNPLWRHVMIAAAQEVAEVAGSAGIALPFADPVRYTLEIARATAENKSSMLQDILRGAPTEIAAISGAVVRAATRHHVAAPVNAFLHDAVGRKVNGQLFDAETLTGCLGGGTW